MIVALDGTDRAKLTVGLLAGKTFRVHELTRDTLEATLPLLLLFFKKHRLSFTTLNGLAVVPGPGHFSSIREIAVLANTLAWQTGIPLFSVQGPLSFQTIQKRKRIGVITPHYGRSPHITKPKPVKMRV